MTYDAARYIIRAHEVVGHTSARKTHQKLLQEVCGITQDDVGELLLSDCR